MKYLSTGSTHKRDPKSKVDSDDWTECAPTFAAADAEHLHAFNERMNDSIAFSERIWLESKKRLKYADQKSANIGLRSTYALRLYSWAKKYVSVGTKSISLEQLRKVLGQESVKDADGNIIQEAPLPIWGNLRQRALDMSQINRKTDLNIVLDSLGRSKHRRVVSVTFAIKEKAVPKGD